MPATAVQPFRRARALTEDVYAPSWEVPTLNSAAFSRTKTTLVPAGQIRPRIVVTTPDLPGWIAPTAKALSGLLNLSENWDSYGGARIQEAIVVRALILLTQILGINSPAPSVVPLSDGGIQLEWHRKQQDLEIVFPADALPTYFYCDRHSGIEDEATATEIVKLTNLIESIS
ncbi:hypothetical protein DYQ86_08640 [Acidobacteria bacterium AB60]|nr:hypothetical protein DYQ86_08640 [Acidobacteria bacterium AB60]